ncbi:MAG: PEP-CTERM sorting domain-containing protein [Akkermansiaceae bacterium]|jgi:hypothetical protein|nr:PEP-CTERM sorting domain-containing protein [Akkermansiaceae bacterium]MCU0777772.1 PEP-CTERM sorting domain-containing protein [Akkermansiaceae bacterium]
MKLPILTFCTAAIVSNAGAVVLTTLPTPMNQGGMIHLNIALNGNALTVDPEPGTPDLKPLAAWKPGDTLDPASPWYSTLDPTQGAGLFNSQFGLVLFNSDPLPPGTKIMVGWVSGTPGMEAYQWKNTEPQLFTGILGTDGSPASWDWGSVAHGMMHPLFVMPAGSSGSANVTLSFTLADGDGSPVSGYTPAQTTMNFTVVPEPSALLLSAAGCLFGLRRRRASSIPS